MVVWSVPTLGTELLEYLEPSRTVHGLLGWLVLCLCVLLDVK